MFAALSQFLTFRPFAIAGIISALVITGCTSRQHFPRPNGDQAPRPTAGIPTDTDFAYQKQRRFPAARLEQEDKNFLIKGVSLSSSGQNGQVANLVTARYYQSKKPGRKPLVII